VSVDDPVPVGLYQHGRDFPQKPRQHDEVDTTGLQIRDIGRAAEKLFLLDQQDGDVCRCRNIQYARVGIIADDKMDRDSGVIPEMGDDPGGIGTCS